MIELCSSEKCTGCGACYNACPKHCITMVPEGVEGFLYPVINTEHCVECGLCRKSCPILTPSSPKCEPIVYAAWNLDDGIRQTSSSGGMFYSLAEAVIRTGGVVYGVVMSGDGTVQHQRAESVQELTPMKGSKYVQSDTRKSYSKALVDLRQGRKVMFTGTPCQVAAFRSFLNKRSYDNLLLVDIVCHGVPSNKLFKDYLEKLEKEKGCSVCKSSFTFREFNAWGYAPSVKLTDGTRQRIPPQDDVYMRHFLASYISRDSCYNCMFSTTPRHSDITIADFWGIGSESHFEGEPKKGCSLVLINSETGKDAFDAIKSHLFYEKRTLSEAKNVNHQLYRPSERPKQRNGAYGYFFSHSIAGIYSHYYNTPYHKLRHLVGKILRAINVIK